MAIWEMNEDLDDELEKGEELQLLPSDLVKRHIYSA